MKQKNFNNCKHDLSMHDVHDLVAIIGKSCSQKTKKRLESILTYSSSQVESCGILERLIYENFQWSYVAGQSYTDEIRIVRNIILGRI